MRITRQAQIETRTRILDAAGHLFRTTGFEATTTREIAAAAGIATGTLFNYFPTKESIVMTFVADALECGRENYSNRRRPDATLVEDLFDLISAGLRELKPHRSYLRVALETAFGPATRTADEVGNQSESVRVDHLETVQESLVRNGLISIPPIALQLYWTLYCGVLAHWIDDHSRKQEDTLALLDQSLQMFVNWLQTDSSV